MAIGKAGPKINLKKLSIKFGDLKLYKMENYIKVMMKKKLQIYEK